ncbi:urease accessory protein UreD [Mesorhizobium sp. L-8-3]|nr:urease accessory protein UreD [Mesorhizobium sp. L-8-3]
MQAPSLTRHLQRELDEDAAQPLSLDGGSERRWRAELELWFAPAGGQTRLLRRRHSGPLMVQRPFHPESDGTCHVYLLHPPGGVAGGDSLELTFHLAEGARVVLTTPGATKFYRSVAGKGSQRSVIDVEAGAVCEYLPQEAIMFDGASADVGTCVTIAETGTYVGWDFTCLGRPAARERFRSGGITQRVEIRRNGKPIWIERFCLPGDSPLQGAAFALAGHPVFGTMVYAGPLRDGLAELARRAAGDMAGCLFSASQLDDVVVCRYLGPHAEQGKILFARVWDALRTALQSKPASAPRIWAT